MLGLDQIADIYSRGVDGSHSVLVKSALPVRLGHIASNGAAPDRVELANMRRLLWDADYYMPGGAEVEVGGSRWATIDGTFAAPRGPNGQVAFRRCDVVKTDDAIDQT